MTVNSCSFQRNLPQYAEHLYRTLWLSDAENQERSAAGLISLFDNICVRSVPLASATQWQRYLRLRCLDYTTVGTLQCNVATSHTDSAGPTAYPHLVAYNKP